MGAPDLEHEQTHHRVDLYGSPNRLDPCRRQAHQSAGPDAGIEQRGDVIEAEPGSQLAEIARFDLEAFG